MTEKVKGKKGKGRNLAFHHLLLSNLTTASYSLSSGLIS